MRTRTTLSRLRVGDVFRFEIAPDHGGTLVRKQQARAAGYWVFSYTSCRDGSTVETSKHGSTVVIVEAK